MEIPEKKSGIKFAETSGGGGGFSLCAEGLSAGGRNGIDDDLFYSGLEKGVGEGGGAQF